jgi:hypothetical protein
MDKNLRVSEDGDRGPGEPTAKARTSKSALLGQVAGSDVQRRRHRQEIGAGLDFVMSHDAGLLKRLEDACVRASSTTTSSPTGSSSSETHCLATTVMSVTAPPSCRSNK